LSNIVKSIYKSSMKESFGSFIKKLRIENNLILTQLAAKLDLDSANFSKIETGKRGFDDKTSSILLDFNSIRQYKKRIIKKVCK